MKKRAKNVKKSPKRLPDDTPVSSSRSESSTSNPHEDRIFIYEIYTELIDSIQHFDALQNSYRMLTSKCLLAAFVSMGFVISLNPEHLPFDRLLGVIFIALVTIIAITVLWCSDLIFKERLLVSSFIEALKLEKKHAWLPRVHCNMLEGDRHHSVPNNKLRFYIAYSACLISVIGLSTSHLIGWHRIGLMSVVLCLTVTSIWTYAYLLKKFSGDFENFMQIALNNTMEKEWQS